MDFVSVKQNNIVGNEDYGSTKITCVYQIDLLIKLTHCYTDSLQFRSKPKTVLLNVVLSVSTEEYRPLCKLEKLF